MSLSVEKRRRRRWRKRKKEKREKNDRGKKSFFVFFSLERDFSNLTELASEDVLMIYFLKASPPDERLFKRDGVGGRRREKESAKKKSRKKILSLFLPSALLSPSLFFFSLFLSLFPFFSFVSKVENLTL